MVVTEKVISKELQKRNKKQEEKLKELKEMEAMKAIMKANLDKELKQRIKNGTVENNKIKKHHHKNEKNKKDKNKEIIDSDEDDELVIPTFGEHPGFMPIVMHKLTEHKIKSSELVSKRLESAKDVRNLLWTAVAVAERKLVDTRKGMKIVDKGTQTCLLEFIARMVGGAYTPFAFIKEDSKNFKTHHHHHITSFIYALRKNDIAFLSSGYRKFWREKITEEKFKELEKKVIIN
uniref:Uncharacterized protein n=1 Tax=Meloidogyne javanica TaxID=6303 RepID=A0A915LYC2_MELJA